MKKQQAHLITKHNWLWIIAIAMGVLLVGLVVHHHLQTSAQNKTFQDTQSWLKGTMDSVSVKNPGSLRVSDPYCRRPSAKYEQTDRVCSVGEYIFFPSDLNTVNSKAIDIQTQFVTVSGVHPKLKQGSFGTQIRGYAFTRNDLSCFISYYSLNNEDGTKFSPKMTAIMTGLLASASCSGPAMADYFPNR